MKMQLIPGLCCLLCVCNYTRAQLPVNGQGTVTTGKTQFLWFTGHWSPSKKNVFIVEKDSTGSGGGTVTLRGDGSVTTTGPDLDKWNKKIDEGIKKTDDWVNQLNNPVNNIDPDEHQLNQLLLPDAMQRQQEWTSYKIDPGQNLLTPDEAPAKNSNGNSGASAGSSGSGQTKTNSRTLSDVLGEFCDKAKADYNTVINYYKSVKKYNDANLNVSPPPEFEYSCYACDSNIRKSDDTTIAHYVRDFTHPEDSMVRKGVSLLRNYQLFGLSDNIVPAEFENNFRKSGACNYFSQSELSDAVIGIAQHLYWRAEKLVNKYHTHYKAVAAVSRTYFSVARDFMLISALDGRSSSDNTDSYFPIISEMINKNLYDHFDKLEKKHDWKEIGNLNYMMSLARDEALLGSNTADENFFNEMKKISAIFNGFNLNIEMDVKTGKEKGYWISHLKGHCKIGPRFTGDSNQCYKWVVLDENRKDILGLYYSKALQLIDCDLITNQIVGPAGAPVYIGTKKYTANMVGLKMDFCNPGKDTIVLSNFAANPKNEGLWKLPYGPPQPLGITGEEYFADFQRRQELAKSGQADKEADEFKKKNEEMVEEMKKLAAQMKTDTGTKRLADYQKIMAMSKKAGSSVADNGVVAKLLYLDFEIPVKNNDRELVNTTFEGAKINPRFSNVIVYANYKILIENETVHQPSK
jgi:hypothetical protein